MNRFERALGDRKRDNAMVFQNYASFPHEPVAANFRVAAARSVR